MHGDSGRHGERGGGCVFVQRAEGEPANAYMYVYTIRTLPGMLCRMMMLNGEDQRAAYKVLPQ